MALVVARPSPWERRRFTGKWRSGPLASVLVCGGTATFGTAHATVHLGALL